MSDRPKQTPEPVDRLTRMCDAMADAFRAHPEHREGDKAVVFLSDPEMGGIVVLDYEDTTEAIAALLMHIKALVESNGKTLDIMFMGEDGIDRVG